MAMLRRVSCIGLLVAFFAVPVAARATLVFVRNPLHPQVWVANDNGKHAHELLAGSNPRVSPDGKIVALMRQGTGRGAQPELVLAPADRGAPPSVLVKGWRNPYVFAWSPDSKSVAAVLGPELGRQRLVLIDTVTGAQRVVAKGYFNGVSFEPGGTRLVYGKAESERYPPRSDLYKFDPNGPDAQGASWRRLTTDHSSTNPVWGPNGKIVFARQLGAKKRRYGPKNELYLIEAFGGKAQRLTRTKVDPLAVGLTPTAWAPSGSRLLAQFGGQDLTYAVAVNPRTGAQHPLVEATEQGFVGSGFSADGKLVLGYSGGGDPGLRHDVETIPYGGGKAKILAKNAFEPSWGG